MKRMKKILAILLIYSMCFSNVLPVMAETIGIEQDSFVSSTLYSSSSDGTLVTDMPEGERVYITLADNQKYRWNANDLGLKGNVIHLDDFSGSNCSFQLYRVKEHVKQGKKEVEVETDYYGIRYESTGYFADIEGKSNSEKAVLHLYENRESKLEDNEHRQFAFYLIKTDSYGNKYYYIKNRKSGLWLGYNTDNQKIWQTSKDKRKQWIITNCVVPKRGGEVENLVNSKEDGTYISLFKKDTLECVTSKNDFAAEGTDLHFFRMGTNSKILMKWNSKYSAYELAYCTDGENNLYDKVWDVESEGASDDNPSVHLWSRQSKRYNKNTSQLWRFFKQNDGSYTIQNAKTGKFIGYKYEVDKENDNTKDRKSSGDLIQWDGEKSVLKKSGDKTTYAKLAYFTIDAFAGTDNPVNFHYADEWMKDIPDDVLLSSVNIPATHDTGTAAVLWDASAQCSISTCQKYYYGEQLNVGARCFDIRCNADDDDTSPAGVRIVHGGMYAPCYDRDGSRLYLQSILDDSIRFLKEHPSETIILVIKADGGSEKGLAKAVGSFIKNNIKKEDNKDTEESKDYIWTGEGIPTMKEARGKIVLMRRYSLAGYDCEADGLKESYFGLDLTNWDLYNYSEKQFYAVQIYNDPKNEESVYVQDAYKESSNVNGKKRQFVEGALKQTAGEDLVHPIPNHAWVFNYTSSTAESGADIPLDQTRTMNPWLYDLLHDKNSKYRDKRTGIVMMNFIDIQMSKLIYETNFNGGNFFAPDATAPTKVTLTYGETLGDVEFEGETGDGTWKFDDPTYKPTYLDYKYGKEFSMTFTPRDTSVYAKRTAYVQITDLVKKKVKVTIDDKEITYGDAEPEYTYSFNESQLEERDTLDDLGITLLLESQTLTSEGKIKVGEWKIVPSYSSSLYEVEFTGLGYGTLKVSPKKLEIKWINTNPVYTGEPANVTAEIIGVIPGDDCKIKVTGGDAIEPSWNGKLGTPLMKYTATVEFDTTGRDCSNYQLPEDRKSVNYYIRRQNADDYVFPTEARMIYGQKLSEATLIGESGDGRFAFVSTDIQSVDRNNFRDLILSDTMPDHAGTFEYRMVYIPNDIDKGIALSPNTVTVYVEKKPMVVTAMAHQKTFGDAKPEFTYSYDESQLVESDRNDSEFDLGLNLTAKAGDNQLCNIGKYLIEKESCTSTKYDVTVISSYLTVIKREVELQWSGQSQYTYDGESVNITAKLKLPENWPIGNLENYKCEVVVTDGNHKDVGSYKAKAISLTNGNFTFKFNEDNPNTTFNYEIVKADPEVTFPISATITYGQTLEQAVFEGEDSKGMGEFVFVEDTEEFLTVGDTGSLYTVKFVPYDTENYNEVVNTVKIPVTVNPKNIIITAHNNKKVYGQDTPQYTWHMDELQLVGNDNVSQFEFMLTAGDGDDKYCHIGNYQITLQKIVKQNDNYIIDFNEGTLRITPLLAEIEWNSTSDIVVGGKGPSARIKNLVRKDDDCQVVVEYADGTGKNGTDKPSWITESDEPEKFSAKITGFEGEARFDYTMPEEEYLEIQYLVRKAEATDYRMPEGAVMTYGQKLSEARLIGALGDGTFQFVEKKSSSTDIGNTVPDSVGEHTYTVKFIPNNVNQQSVYEEISVTVRPKEITINAISGEKTYGEETILDFELDESQLVLNDKKEDLKLVLTAVNETGEDISGDKVNSPVGVYEIRMKECLNSNYNVKVVSAEFVIHQKVISLIWSDVSNLVCTGDSVNVTAKADGILDGDQCEVKVINGDNTKPGTYIAQAVSLSNSNYALSEDYAQLIKEYTIQEVSDNGNAGSESMNTGDHNDMPIWILLAILAMSVATLNVINKRKQN